LAGREIAGPPATRARHHEAQQRGRDAAKAYENGVAADASRRVRRVRIVRDYGKYDRREAPQYYADARGATTIHA